MAHPYHQDLADLENQKARPPAFRHRTLTREHAFGSNQPGVKNRPQRKEEHQHLAQFHFIEASVIK